MKNLFVAAFSLLIFTFTATAAADSESPFFVGLMLGELTLDIQSHNYDARRPVDNSNAVVPDGEIWVNFEAQDSQRMAFLINGGYNIFDWLAVEAQITTSLGADEVYAETRNSTSTGNPPVSTPFSTMEISTQATGVYAVFQTSGEAYVKARFGIANSTADFETDFASKSFSSTHLSYGLSIGQKFGIGAFELLYMRYPDVKVSRQEFRDAFYSGEKFDRTGATVARRLTLEILAVGYVFSF